jgi:CTP:molybdopterin cytidylyltransferase MocA
MADTLLVALLAAGRGARFGTAKLDAMCAGKPLGRWALDAVTAAALPAGVIVVGPGGAKFAAGTSWELIDNPLAAEGLGTSLAVAARTAEGRGASKLLVLLADMPLVEAGYLCDLAGAMPPAATAYPGRKAGVPALFGRDQLAMLTRLDGDRGAGALLAAMAGLSLLDPPVGMLADVDRPDDLAEVERALRAP